MGRGRTQPGHADLLVHERGRGIHDLRGARHLRLCLGAPAYLAFCSVSLSYAVGYWLMPRIWRAGRQEGFVTQADYFAARYEAPWLGVLTGVIGIASLVIYVQIQLISLGLIVRPTLGSDLSTVAATLIAAALDRLRLHRRPAFGGLRRRRQGCADDRGRGRAQRHRGGQGRRGVPAGHLPHGRPGLPASAPFRARIPPRRPRPSGS